MGTMRKQQHSLLIAQYKEEGINLPQYQLNAGLNDLNDAMV
jgi:hypothetical protein